MFIATKQSGPTKLVFVDDTVKFQIYDYAIASGDTTGTLIPDSLKTISAVFSSGYLSTTTPTVSGTTLEFSYTNPAAVKTGSILIIGT